MNKSHPTETILTVLGSGTCVPSLERSACSLLIEMQNKKLLLDIGPGTIRRVLETHTAVSDISHILLSHFHPDHTGELASFLFSSKYASTGPRKTPLTLVGGKGIHGFFDRLSAAYPGWIELPPEIFKIIELDNTGKDHYRNEHFTITSLPVEHNEESIAYRIADQNGKSIVYSGDTDYCKTLVDIAENADVFVCESAFPDEMKVPGHLTPSLAGEIASKAGAGRLMLTHFYPQCDMKEIEKQCRKTYQGPLTLAADLLKIKVR